MVRAVSRDVRVAGRSLYVAAATNAPTPPPRTRTGMMMANEFLPHNFPVAGTLAMRFRLRNKKTGRYVCSSFIQSEFWSEATAKRYLKSKKLERKDYEICRFYKMSVESTEEVVR